jgi:signal transduction histidine kinase
VDRDSFKRVLSNIIQNSLKYMDKPERRVTIRTSVDSNSFTLSIGDNGPGIPADAVAHIFERFYRAEQSRNTSTGGSGLGLAIAKQIIVEHGGAIYADCIEGSGTVIRIVLPVKKGGAAL